MTTKQFLLDCKLTLVPVWHQEPPEISVFIVDKHVYSGPLLETVTLCYTQTMSPGQHYISVNFTNKTDKDTVLGTDLDKAVIVDRVEFNSVSDPKFVWEGIYRPRYSPSWLLEQPTPPAETLQYRNYMGWNGEWRLDFTTPIFTWIHQVNGHGWTYD